MAFKVYFWVTGVFCIADDQVIVGNRCGTLVSADSTGSVQFWDSQHGTLLQAHSFHKGDVNALAAAPSHNRVFSAGSDGQVWTIGPLCR